MNDTNAVAHRPAFWLDAVLAKIKHQERWVLLLGAAIQLAVLLGMMVMRLWTQATGDVYFVRVQPVDPRDFFRGDFVILSYEFSRVPTAGIEGWPDALQNPDHNMGRDIYVALAREGDGKHWRAVRFSAAPPGVQPYLLGRLDNFGRIEYGIESFFVQEGQGREYEEAVRSRRLTAEITITPSGQAALRALHIDH